MNSNTVVPFEVKPFDFHDKRMDKVKVMVCQLNFDQMDFEKKSRLYFVTNNSKNKEYLRKFINIASRQQVDLLVFPELTIPTEFVNELVSFSKQNDMYIIGGTHYKKTDGGYLSICPIVTPFGMYYTEKITPSPFETSSFVEDADGAVPGHNVMLFLGTRMGNFAVTICLDYTNRELKRLLYENNLDFLIITAFNGKSDVFFHSMQSEIQDAENGLYLIYSNTLSKSIGGEGRSALFAFVDDCYKSEFQEKKRTDSKFSNKIYEFTNDKSFCIFELDIEHKIPYKSKNWHTISNVKVLMEDDIKMDNNYKFLQAIRANDNKYLFINQYYVKPREYEEMKELLERENVLVITGDPGTGKTYTAIHFLWEYYNKGFKPTWYYGMDKEDRDSQKNSLMDFEPQKNDIVYIEDPFGKTAFENRDELKTLFGNLVQRFRACKAKLVISSRTEVFKRFEEESLGRDKLEDFMKELNVRKPSYGKEELEQIAKRYIKAYTNWSKNEEILSMVIEGIEKRKLISPMMIFNFVKNHSESEDLELLKSDLEKALETDLVTQFADEIKSLSSPAKILLYLVLLYGRGKKGRIIANYKELFEIVQKKLYNKIHFDESPFYYELKKQENYRIQRLGEQFPHYRFSHPAYEEALISLSMKDSTCFIIAETSIKIILKEDSENAVSIFQRFVLRYPQFLENIINGISPQDFEGFSEEDKMHLNRKMLLSNNEVFHKNARKIYPIKKLIEGLYSDEGTYLLYMRIRLLSLRENEIGKISIDWPRVFTKDRISSMYGEYFLACCKLALTIDECLMRKIECNLQKNDIVRKFLLLEREKREELIRFLSETTYKNIYQDLKDKIPEEIMLGRINKKGYAKTIKQYLLSDKPKGCIYIDNGAMCAMYRQSNLYPIGVVDVTGDFVNGDVVNLVQRETNSNLLSLTEMSSDDIRKYKGLHSSEIYELEDQLVSTIISRPFRRERKHRKNCKKN